MKKYTALVVATAFTTAFSLPFVFTSSETKAQDNTQPTSICEPFPDCVIYHIDQSTEQKTES
ncbi:hypothetical protein [Shewanella sedimentimangrovi]|uniref:Uncharacterized protein n=1 Tax=Shewanella sedimentimangrovi TaxID=2814293 RepID=A0ABX7R1T2_9GAMM|nr:hypothetical protein [Shewanella sedimentimangrovi]QSX37772.1 hypothetical protein JYB85_02715 [Shewanella sedimentimangrovi]